jgi:hypothetical protein
MSALPPRPGSGPAPDVPLRYLVLSAAAFVLAAPGVAWLAPELAGHYYHPHVVALTHVVTLGWITFAIMGASYQLVPIVLGRRIWSERLARWQYWLLLLGVSGMVAHFYAATWPGLVLAAGLFAAGVVLHLMNMALTLRGFDRRDFTARLIVLGYAGLALTMVFGLLLGGGHVVNVLPGDFFATLHAHVHLALLGWIMPMVLGVAARVYPMFLLAPAPHGWPERLQFWGLAIGVPLVTLGLLLRVPAAEISGALAVAGAAAGHLARVVWMARRRRRPHLDWGLRLVLTGATFIVPGSLLGLALVLGLISGPRFALAYMDVVLGGWISLTIAGMMLKIVPFLVWYRVYSPRAGKERVPTLPDLSWVRAEGAACVLLTAGFIALAGAMVGGSAEAIRAAGVVLALGALAFGAALGRVLALLAHAAPAAMPSRWVEVKR